MTRLYRKDLERLWEEATDLPPDSPLHKAIIEETLEGSDNEDEYVDNAGDVAYTLNVLVGDILRFSQRIAVEV